MRAEEILFILASTLRVSTPLILAALGGLVSEKSGVINIALEGFMLVGAFAAAATAYSTHSAAAGAVAAAFFGAVFALVYGFSVIKLRANQIVAGTAMNFLAAGVTPFLCKIFFNSSGGTPSLALDSRFSWEPIGWAVFALLACTYLMKFTPAGLWIEFAGENPHALESAGIKVNKVRWSAVALSGLLAGLGGASLSIFLASSFTRNMSSGRGFMALAALIFGKWRPVTTVVACLLFGFADALQIRLQGVILWGAEPVPVQFIQILPYLVTIFVLAGMVGRSRSPKALGTPFIDS